MSAAVPADYAFAVARSLVDEHVVYRPLAPDVRRALVEEVMGYVAEGRPVPELKLLETRIRRYGSRVERLHPSRRPQPKG